MTEERDLVSVIVPMYNSEAYLRECLDSLLAQTHGEFEAVCVDDGSPDASAQVACEYAARDPRVRVVRQGNAGPGAARNRGIDEARGSWIAFLDADDWAEPFMLEDALAVARPADAQMAVLPYNDFDVRSGLPLFAEHAVLPDAFPPVFSWRDNPDLIFRACTNLPWNKVLRADFVRDAGLRFQEDVRLTEDLMFSAPALVAAERIVFAPRPSVFHRMGTGGNAMSGKDAHPLDFVAAFAALRAHLERAGVWDELHVGFANWCADGCLYNLTTLNTPEAFSSVFYELAEGAAERLGLLDVPDEAYAEDRYRAFLAALRHEGRFTPEAEEAFLYEQYVQAREGRDLFVYFDGVSQARIAHYQRQRAELRAQVADLEAQLARERERVQAAEQVIASLQDEYDRRMNAAEQKVGQAICRPARAVQRAWLARSAGAPADVSSADVAGAPAHREIPGQ